MDNKEVLKLYKGFCEYITDTTGIREVARADANTLHREIKQCIRQSKPLGSWWQMLAYDLFARRNIKDERIAEPDVIEQVSFEHDGTEYTVDVGYINFDISKFPENSTLTQNVLREDERKYIKRTMISFIDRFDDVDTTKVNIYRNYVLVFRNNDKKKE